MTTPLPPNPAEEEDQGTSDASVFVPRRPTREEVKRCSFRSWYGLFRDVPREERDETATTTAAAAPRTGGRRRRRRRRKNVTIESAIVPLPPEFRDYLLSDGMVLPDGADRLSSCVPASGGGAGSDGWSSDSDDGGGGEEDADGSDSDSDDDDKEGGGRTDGPRSDLTGEEAAPRRFSFPELNASVSSAIEALGGGGGGVGGGGGGVLPKLNWSAPRDAAWMNGGTTKCLTPGDVYLLLKSSDFVAHDVLHAFDELAEDDEGDEGDEEGDPAVVSEGNQEASEADGARGGGTGDEERADEELYLVLRKWANLHPSMEFRCFVKNRTLLAISQRNHTQRYAHLTAPSGMRRVQSLLVDFYETYVRDRYEPSERGYVFDAYLDKSDRAWLIDFNVWGTRTDPLLFEWEELEAMEATAMPTNPERTGENEEDDDDVSDDEDDDLVRPRPEVRVVTAEMEVRHDPLASYRAPIDAVELAGGGGAGGAGRGSVAKSFEEFMAMCERPSDRDDEDDDES